MDASGTEKLSKAMLNQLIMDYLVIEGHKEAAECFQAESGTAAGLDLDTIVARREIRHAAECGDVRTALDRAQTLSPELLSDSPELDFFIHQQQLVELIRANRAEEAVAFAQGELGPKAELSAPLLAELERTMLLLAYPVLDDCPERDLLSQAQRQRTASRLNAAVLSSLEQEKEATLPLLFRRLLSEHDSLRRRHHMLPTIDFDPWGSHGAFSLSQRLETESRDSA